MTISARPKQKLTFDQFPEQYPEDGCYELTNGELVSILATRQHDDDIDSVIGGWFLLISQTTERST